MNSDSAAHSLPPPLPAAAPWRDRWLGPWLVRGAGTLGLLARAAQPLLDLGLRLWLAQVFLVSGVLKLTHWETALRLAQDEYPIAGLAPATTAALGVGVELGGGLLLGLGLLTRPAALALAALTLLVHLHFVALDANLFQMALLGWLLVHGAGRLSLDQGLARGLADSALPLAATAVRAAKTLSALGTDPYLLLVRLWLAAGLIAAGHPVADLWLPLKTVAPLAGPALAVAGVLLAAGLGARAIALGLLLAVLGAPMLGAAAVAPADWLGLSLALLLVQGPGSLSLDRRLGQALQRRFPELGGRPAFALAGLPRVVIVGAGFGGIACAQALRQVRCAVTLVDRRNHYLFQPLLYQVATAGLAATDIASPVREIFREQHNVRVLLGEVTGVDTTAREVRVAGGAGLPYDYLVLATGASHSYFGRDDWAPYAPGLKQVEDAVEVRRRLLLAFERAEAASEAERRAWLTFAIVGGGPTGVELAGALAELARHGMEKDYRSFDPASARILLVQAGARLLPAFPERLSAGAKRALERLGVEVRLASRVDGIDAEGISIGGERIAAKTVVWAAGVAASPAALWLGAPADRAGRIQVGPDLAVPGLPQVFAIGDTALANAWNGQPVPGLGPAAKQGGAYVAHLIRARLEGRRAPAPFAYRHLGSLATIGRQAAVADFGWLRLSGAPAWWLWGVVHVAFLSGLRNRFSVLLQWAWAYLTFRSGTRLITGGPAPDEGHRHA